jgi:beta-xylosidase
VWATRKENKLTFLSVNHALPSHAIVIEPVQIILTNAPEPRQSYIERIDEEHGNARQTWLQMGSPEYLSTSDVERLQTASQLIQEPQSWLSVEGNIELLFDLPPHSLAAITLEFES